MNTMERLLAGLLRYGTWLASAVIGVGLAVSLWGSLPPGMRIITIGIALLFCYPACAFC
jgi:hypothetical protein